MALTVADLIGTLNLDVAGFKRGAEEAAKLSEKIAGFTAGAGTAAAKMGETLDKAGEQGKQGLAKVDTEAQKTGKSLSDLITPANLAAAAIGTALVASLKSALNEASQFADEIHRLQLLTGSSVRDLTSLVDVANDVGVEFGAVQMALLRLANASAESDGVLAQFNLTAKDGVGRLVQLAQKLSGVTDANQRAAIASEVFGARIAAGLLPLVDRLKNGMVDLSTETNDFANILDEDGVTALRNFGIAQGQVGDALLALKIVVAKDILPLMQSLVSWTEATVKAFYSIPPAIRQQLEGLALLTAAVALLGTAYKTLAFLGITPLLASFVEMVRHGSAATAAATVLADGYVHLAAQASSATTAIGLLKASLIALVALSPLIIKLAFDMDLGGISSKLEASGRSWGRMIGDAIRKAITGETRAESMLDEGVRALARQGAKTARESGIAILPKEVLEANDAIKKQIETLKAQKIELEQGAIAALKYSLAHGEMAKASPALKAQLIALTQGVQSLKQEQDIATNTFAEAADELHELNKKERELTQAIKDANAATREQNLLFADAGRFADEMMEEFEGVIARTRELLQWEQGRIDLQERLKQLSPAEAEQQRNQALQAAITLLQRYKSEALSTYGSEAQVVKDVDREILKLTADQAELQKTTLTFGNAIEHMFSGISDILSLLGVKVGKFFLLLQNLPRAVGGVREVFAGLGGLLTLGSTSLGLEGTAFAETAKAVTALGHASGQTAGVFGFLTGAITLAIKAFSLFSVGLASLFQSAGITPDLAGGLATLVTGAGLSFGLGSLIPGPGGLGASVGGTFGTGLSLLAPGLGTQLLGTILGPQLFTGLFSAIGPALTTMLGGLVLPGIGFAVGAILGPLLGGLFSGPTPGISGQAFLNPTNVATLLNTQLGSVVNPPGASHYSYIQSGPLTSNMYMFRTNGALDRDQAQVAISTILLETLQAATESVVALIPRLPTEALSQALSDRLDAVLAEGFEITNFDFGEDDLIENFQGFLEGLAGETLQTFSEKIFGPIDLAALGAGDAVKGFDSLTSAMNAFSAVMTLVAGPTVTFTGTLEEFAQASIDFFGQFQQEGEEFIATIQRITQVIGEIVQLQDQIQATIAQLSGNSQILIAQFARAQDQIVQLADAFTISAVSGSQPDEVLRLAQQLFSLIQSSLTATVDLATNLHDEVTRLQQAQTDAVDGLADLTSQIIALGGNADTALNQLNAAISATAAGIVDDTSALVSLFASRLQSDIAAFAQGGKNPFQGVEFRTDFEDGGYPQQGLVALPVAHIEPLPGAPPLSPGDDLNDLFLDIFTAIRTSTDPQAAIANLNQLAQVIQQGLADAIQIVQAQFAERRRALEEASRLRVEALIAERSLIVENFQVRREALETEKERVRASMEAQRDALEQQLATAQAYASVIGSGQQLQTDLFNLLAPTTPISSLTTVREQFRQALTAFQGSPSPEAATRVQELARQAIDLAKQTPGFDLPSLAFRELTDEVTAALQVIEHVVSAMPSQEALQQQIVALDQMQADTLASIDEQIEQLNIDEQQALAAIDAQIEAENVALRAQLDLLSQQEQAAIEQMQQVVAQNLTIIRDEIIRQMGLLAIQQQQAVANLQQLLGGLTFDEFLAQTQAAALVQLQSINQTLQQFLNSLVGQASSTPVPLVIPTVPTLPALSKGPESMGTGLEQTIPREGPGFLSASGLYITNKMIGAQHGLEYVPRTEPVLLHQGEMVLPTTIAEQVRSGRANSHTVVFSPSMTIQITGEVDAERLQENLDKAMSRIVRGPSRTKSALVELARKG